MRPQVVILLGLVAVVAAAFIGVGRIGGAVALGVAGAAMLAAGILYAGRRTDGPA